jgi:transmembrane sensor
MKTLETRAPWDEDDAISPRAADFIERQRFAEWGDADQAELDAWLAESTFHRVAYLRLEAALAYTDHLAEIRTFKIGPKLEEAEPNRDSKLISRRFVLPLLAAASIALAAIWGGPFAASLLQPPDRTDSTAIGGRTLVSFSDHTQIELNTDSAIRFRMTTAERTVWLEKGEAWFRVAHDAAHPFTVIVGKHRITDLGTEFVVRRNTDGVDVALLNGRATLNAEGVQNATLNPGDEAVATHVSLSVTRKTPQELADELAWRQGMLVFRKTKLSEVVREFNRYNATRLVIADPSIANVQISAKLRADDYESFLELAQDPLKLRVDREGSVVLISRGPDDTKKKVAHLKRNL